MQMPADNYIVFKVCNAKVVVHACVAKSPSPRGLAKSFKLPQRPGQVFLLPPKAKVLSKRPGHIGQSIIIECITN